MSGEELLGLINKAREADIKANRQVINNHLDAADRILSQLAAQRIIMGPLGVADGANPLQVAK